MRQPINKYWPGIILSSVIIAIHASIILATFWGVFPTVLAILLLSITYHLAYTAFHEAAHGLLGKGLSPVLGGILGQIMGVSFAAHNYLHNKSHHFENTRETKGPDNSSAVKSFMQVLMSQYLNIFFLKKGSGKTALWAFGELIFIFGSRLFLISHTQNDCLIYVLILAPILGGVMIYLVFDCFVHRATPDGRATITHLFPKNIHGVISCLLAFQNYHVVHHVDPNTPFHLYPARFQILVYQNQLKQHELKIWICKDPRQLIPSFAKSF